MARRKKQVKFSERLLELGAEEVRPVTKADEWCRTPLENGKVPEREAPWGYVVTIPKIPNQNMILGKIEGYIVRVKKHCGKLMLQVVSKELRTQEYGVKSFTKNVSTNKKSRKQRRSRIWHIRNMNKSQGKWETPPNPRSYWKRNW